MRGAAEDNSYLRHKIIWEFHPSPMCQFCVSLRGLDYHLAWPRPHHTLENLLYFFWVQDGFSRDLFMRTFGFVFRLKASRLKLSGLSFVYFDPISVMSLVVWLSGPGARLPRDRRGERDGHFWHSNWSQKDSSFSKNKKKRRTATKITTTI